MTENIQVIRKTNPFVIILASMGAMTLVTLLLLAAGIFFALRSGISTVTPEITGERVGVLEITAPITDAREILAQLRKFRKDDDIKAVIARIDSPGGAVGASQELYSALKITDETKPVIASLGSVAASGGYYAALGARYIISNPGTVTGSIGVIMKVPNFMKLMDTIGVSTTTIKSGALKDLGAISREMTPDERKVLESVADDIHNQFIEAVAESRNIPEEKARDLSDGRIFSGRQALEAGLVDELGGFDRAIEKAGELAGIEGAPSLQYPEENNLDLFRRILEEGASGSISKAVERLGLSSSTPGAY
jgi:protease-4